MSLLSESIMLSTKIHIFLSNYFITYSIYICFYFFHNIVYQVNFLTCVTPQYFSRISKESKDEVRPESGSPGLHHRGHSPWSRGASEGKNWPTFGSFLFNLISRLMLRTWPRSRGRLWTSPWSSSPGARCAGATLSEWRTSPSSWWPASGKLTNHRPLF